MKSKGGRRCFENLASIRTNNFQDEHYCRKIQLSGRNKRSCERSFAKRGTGICRKSLTMLVITKETTVLLSVDLTDGDIYDFDTSSRPIKYLRLIRRIRKRFFMLGRDLAGKEETGDLIEITLLTEKYDPDRLAVLLRLSGTKFSVFLH